jgi:hypothetical protein
MQDLPPDMSQTTLDVIELWGKLVGVLVATAGFFRLIWKPYTDWKRKQLAEMIRAVLKEELTDVGQLKTGQEEIMTHIRKLERQVETLFNDVDSFIEIATDNRERHDETADLLNAMGLSSDRRVDPDRREHIDGLMSGILDRRKSRRRRDD